MSDNPDPKFKPLDILGQSGLKRVGGYTLEEFNPKLSGSSGAKTYRDMRDTDPLIGGIALAFDSLIRKTKWIVKPSDETPDAAREADFVESCMEDMSHSWNDFISEVISKLWFGWSYHEIVYKIRSGSQQKDASRRSKHTDGRVGWRKLPIRSQDTLFKWEFQDDGGINGMWQLAPPNYTMVYIPIQKALLFRTTSSKNNPEGRSMLRNAYRSFYFKRKLEEIEAIGIERDLAGLPDMTMPVEYFAADASAQMKAVRSSMETMLANIRVDQTAFILRPAEEQLNANGQTAPTGFKFKLISSAGVGRSNPDGAITRHRSELAMSLLAEFILLGQDGVGSYALATSKTTMFGAVISSVLQSISSVLNRFAVPRLMVLNGIAENLTPTLEVADPSGTDIDQFASAISSLLTSNGISADLELENHIRAVLGLPEKPETPEQESAETPGETLQEERDGIEDSELEPATPKEPA